MCTHTQLHRGQQCSFRKHVDITAQPPPPRPVPRRCACARPSACHGLTPSLATEVTPIRQDPPTNTRPLDPTEPTSRTRHLPAWEGTCRPPVKCLKDERQDRGPCLLSPTAPLLPDHGGCPPTISSQAFLASPVTGTFPWWPQRPPSNCTWPQQAHCISGHRPSTIHRNLRSAQCPAPRVLGNESWPGPQPSDQTLIHNPAWTCSLEAKSHQGRLQVTP